MPGLGLRIRRCLYSMLVPANSNGQAKPPRDLRRRTAGTLRHPADWPSSPSGRLPPLRIAGLLPATSPPAGNNDRAQPRGGHRSSGAGTLRNCAGLPQLPSGSSPCPHISAFPRARFDLASSSDRSPLPSCPQGTDASTPRDRSGSEWFRLDSRPRRQHTAASTHRRPVLANSSARERLQDAHPSRQGDSDVSVALAQSPPGMRHRSSAKLDQPRPDCPGWTTLGESLVLPVPPGPLRMLAKEMPQEAPQLPRVHRQIEAGF